MDHRTTFFKKADIIIVAALLLAGAAAFALLTGTGRTGAFAVVSVDGELFGRYPLSEDASVEIETEYGHNTLRISDGQVRISEADCPGGDCVQHGAISREGQIILCLPHRLAVTVTAEEGGPDAISY